MNRKRIVALILPLLIVLPGCEACNGGIGNNSKVIAKTSYACRMMGSA